MQCIKTGFYAYLASHDSFVYGDAFRLPIPGAFAPDAGAADIFDNLALPAQASLGHLLLRVCAQHHDTPMISRINLIVHRVDHWFDELRTSQPYNSTLLAAPGQWRWLSYDGQPLHKVADLPASYRTPAEVQATLGDGA